MRDLTQGGLEHLALNWATVRERWDLRQAIEGCARHGIPGIAPWREPLQAIGPGAAARLIREHGLTGETGSQLTLGQKGRLQKQLEEAIRQLKARYGYSPIFRCVDVEPWSVIPEERQILVESDV